MRRAPKLDGNQVAIVKALRAAGALVLSLAAVGKGCPDVLVLFRGRYQLLEIKDGSLPPSARRLTPLQEEFHADWLVTVVSSVDQALVAICSSTA